ncbi:MAG: hypothetical protein AB1413_04800 [Thermodesulfobacteriota bacterium]|jgi:hypothetical protein
MSVLTQLWDKGSHHLAVPSAPTMIRRPRRVTMAQIGEVCWGITTFALFLALGPFSAIAVIFGLGSLVRGQEEKREPHPIG